jgi:hypothetical protein
MLIINFDINVQFNKIKFNFIDSNQLKYLRLNFKLKKICFLKK